MEPSGERGFTISTGDLPLSDFPGVEEMTRGKLSRVLFLRQDSIDRDPVAGVTNVLDKLTSRSDVDELDTLTSRSAVDNQQSDCDNGQDTRAARHLRR